MSLLSPSHTFLRHHVHRNTSISSSRLSLRSFCNAKSSLSLSTKTHQQCLTNNSTYQLHFLPDITSLCESNDLTKAYLLLQENPYNAQIKEAIGVLLQACGRLKNIEIAEGDAEMGRLVHGLAIKLGLNQEIMVNNALVDMYSKWDKCGSFDHLRKMQMEEEMKANKVTVLNALTICLGKSEFPSLKELHGYLLRHGFQNDELVANALVAAYAKCGSMTSAEYVFDGMRSRTVSSWNAVIGGHAQNGDPSKALDFFHQMTCSGLEPDWFSISSLLLACTHLKSLQYGKEIHGFVLRNGLEKDLFVAISLLSLYMYCEKSFSARVLFDGMEYKSLVSWNAMITGYSQNRLPIDALTLFRQMVSNGIQPSEITIMSVFGACSQLSALRLGKETHCYALKASLMDDVFIGCSIIDMYAKCGCIERSRWIFDKLTNKDVASWNAMIVGYGIHGYGKEAIELFEKMQEQGQWPDGFTFVGILMACSHAGLVEDGLKYFNQMQNFHGLKPKLEHYSCVVDMLGRAGQLDDALRLIDEMPEEPDAGVWNSLLSSCRTYGALDMGEKVAKKLLELEPKKAENYVLLSNLFAGSAKWDDVRKVRQSMKENGLQKDAGRSWIELGVNVYSFVAGDDTLPESEDIREMWREIEEKISEIGYKPLTDSVLHEVEEEEKINLLRGHSEKLAISFGLLKTTKGVTLRVCKNLRICVDCHNAAKLISKVADRKIVVRDNKRFHHFRDGFCSCGDFWNVRYHPEADPYARLFYLSYGIGILQAIHNESRSLKKSLKDVVTENEFEKRLLADVIPFSDIGALENVKDTLKELLITFLYI
ncbi:hypothetical protein LWI29_033842 [Acer saccharum]|uniref:DYW domain-containing protein n=1 Tax=Acer saccharum TaxID=4024 RepID=A0AA39VJT6_ACESA|nr:hypothetical protein LWI29_033842 [Acer saccharum]